MIDENVLNWIKKYHRLNNYFSAAMLYLKDNYLLEEELKKEHIKDRILGHWGTVPGLNLIYAGLNYLVKEKGQSTMLILGPGHGAPAVLSNQFIEGTLAQFYPGMNVDLEGVKNLVKGFSWPGGFPSHTYPGVPGNIHEGGELGYSLGTAFGAVLDNPDLIVACVVGDGEAETGPLAAAWHSNKYINPISSGAVLPILHLNGYRISGPTIYGTMSDEEIINYFKGLGYNPIIVDQYKSADVYKDFLENLMHAYGDILNLKATWNDTTSPIWPMIILRTKKGWTMPAFSGDRKLEDHNNSHGVPLTNPKKDDTEFQTLKTWLESYNVSELISKQGRVNDDLYHYVPSDDLRIGVNKHAFGGDRRVPLNLPDLEEHSIPVELDTRGLIAESRMKELGEYFRDIFLDNEANKNFRIFSPDESESNLLEAMYEATERDYMWPVREFDHHYSFDGRMMEILSENVLQEWFEGYVKTGRHGVLISYEAFLSIITSQIDQYIKFVKQSLKFNWRKPLPSMNYIATSTGWRQDHNGFTHQNPSLINSLLTKQTDLVSVYLPADVNTMLVSMEECLSSTNTVNLMVACKRDLPQWLSLEEAREHVKEGIGEWKWAGNYDTEVDIVLASAGDYQTKEVLAAAKILKEEIPELKFKYINVNEVSVLGMGDVKHPRHDEEKYQSLFTTDKPVIFNFHGYPEVIKQMTWGTELSNRMTILGYIEEGTTTTPFDIQVMNKASRYHVCMHAVAQASIVNPLIEGLKDELINKWAKLLEKHYHYIRENGVDLPEVEQFSFGG